MKDKELRWVKNLKTTDAIQAKFNTRLFTAGDSRDPEQAGVFGAVVGSLLTLAITLLLSFPFGVMAAVYLEEFAPKNRWTDIIEVNINNLATVLDFRPPGACCLPEFLRFTPFSALVGGMVSPL